MTTLLFTGSNGFLGRNVLPLLEKAGYAVTTLDIAGADLNVDLATDIPRFRQSCDIVLHAAGKAHHIPRNNSERDMFFDINVEGTRHLCEGLERSGLPRAFIFISTVAVYGCEAGENIAEDHPPNGSSPYAVSKIEAERFLADWAASNNIVLTILRPSLIAGSNPPGNLGAMINGIRTGKYMSIAGGKARKSVLMADDIAALTVKAATVGGVYNVCDDHHPCFGELERVISAQLNKTAPRSIPLWLAKSIALAGDCLGRGPLNSGKLDKITKSLTFSNTKAREQLGWMPLDVLSNFKIS